MPQIDIGKDQTGVIAWGPEDWLSGVNTSAIGGPHNFLGPQLYYPEAMNPYLFTGILSPGPNPEAVTNSSQLGGALMNVVTNGTNSYGVTSNGELQKIDNTAFGEEVVTSGDWATDGQPITGATSGDDVILYYIGDTKYLFYSWRDSNQGYIGQLNLSNDTKDDKWMEESSDSITQTSGTLTVGVRYKIATFESGDDFTNVGGTNTTGSIFVAEDTTPTTWTNGSTLTKVLSNDNEILFQRGDNGMLYIIEGNLIHRFDGQEGTGTFYAANEQDRTLVLPQGYICRGAIPYQDNSLVLFAAETDDLGVPNRNEAKAFFWDYVSELPYSTISLGDNSVAAPFNWNGALGCFTSGRKNLATNREEAKIRIFNGSSFEVETHTTQYPTNHAAVETFSDHIMFIAGARVFTYGSPSGSPKALQRIVNVNSTGRMVKSISEAFLVVSYEADGSRLLQLNQENYASNCDMRTIQTYPSFPPSMKGKVTSVVVDFFGSSSGGRWMNLYLTPDSDDDTVSTNRLFVQIKDTTMADASQEYFTSDSASGNDPLPTFNSLGLYLRYLAGDGETSAPKIKNVKVYFQLQKTK